MIENQFRKVQGFGSKTEQDYNNTAREKLCIGKYGLRNQNLLQYGPRRSRGTYWSKFWFRGPYFPMRGFSLAVLIFRRIAYTVVKIWHNEVLILVKSLELNSRYICWMLMHNRKPKWICIEHSWWKIILVATHWVTQNFGWAASQFLNGVEKALCKNLNLQTM